MKTAHGARENLRRTALGARASGARWVNQPVDVEVLEALVADLDSLQRHEEDAMHRASSAACVGAMLMGDPDDDDYDETLS